jgi:hypothetical protein
MTDIPNISRSPFENEHNLPDTPITPEAVEHFTATALEGRAMTEFDDGRPMVTDLFLVKLLKSNLDDHDRVASIRDWVEGDWGGAMEGLSND